MALAAGSLSCTSRPGMGDGAVLERVSSAASSTIGPRRCDRDRDFLSWRDRPRRGDRERPRRQDEMDRDEVAGRQELVLADQARAARGRLLGRQVLAPRHDVHAGTPGVAGDAAAQRPGPSTPVAAVVYEAHARIASCQSPLQRSGARPWRDRGTYDISSVTSKARLVEALSAARRVADRDAALGRRLVVEARGACAGQHHELQVGQLLDQGARKGGALRSRSQMSNGASLAAGVPPTE